MRGAGNPRRRRFRQAARADSRPPRGRARARKGSRGRSVTRWRGFGAAPAIGRKLTRRSIAARPAVISRRARRRADADLRAGAERHVDGPSQLCLAAAGESVEVEDVRLLPIVRVPVDRVDRDHHRPAFFHRHIAEALGTARAPGHRRCRRKQPHRLEQERPHRLKPRHHGLVDRSGPGHRLDLGGEPLGGLGHLGEAVDRPCQGVGRGLVARRHQRQQHVNHVLVGQAPTALGIGGRKQAVAEVVDAALVLAPPPHEIADDPARAGLRPQHLAPAGKRHRVRHAEDGIGDDPGDRVEIVVELALDPLGVDLPATGEQQRVDHRQRRRLHRVGDVDGPRSGLCGPFVRQRLEGRHHLGNEAPQHRRREDRRRQAPLPPPVLALGEQEAGAEGRAEDPFVGRALRKIVRPLHQDRLERVGIGDEGKASLGEGRREDASLGQLAGDGGRRIADQPAEEGAAAGAGRQRRQSNRDEGLHRSRVLGRATRGCGSQARPS